ncbi:hypothetical protein BH10ACI4_BH10ACI4_06160 [soil metagenome]
MKSPLKSIVAVFLLATGPHIFAQANSPGSKFEQTFLDSVPQHHEDAIQMAKVCTQKAVHPELKSLCQNILSSQTEQKGQMQGWLQSWYGGKGKAPEEMKLRMQTMQQEMMSKLNAANGTAFDHAFITNMGQHHAAGVPEFKECVAHAKHPELKALCGKMEASQKHQITQMNAWAKAWK